MDNLAHSLTGILTGHVVLPKIAKTHKVHLAIASAVLANLPDIDVLLWFFGKDFYMFHHRGFTHSFLGLLVMVPLGMMLVKKIMGVTCPLSHWGNLRFVLLQLLFSHYFLDYLTTYGTMFFYPFSFERFSFPLMFIIDPWFWLITGIGVLFLWKKEHIKRRVLFLSFTSIFLLWGVELSVKRHAEALFTQALKDIEKTDEAKVIKSYPLPFAPFFWLLLKQSETVIEENDSDASHYYQGVVSYIRKFNGYIETFDIPKKFQEDKLCHQNSRSEETESNFLQFKTWAEHSVCREQTIENKNGCFCFSLKYSIAQINMVTFGGYWIPKVGPASFLAPNVDTRLRTLYRRFLSE